jgi:hypothetical protein
VPSALVFTANGERRFGVPENSCALSRFAARRSASSRSNYVAAWFFCLAPVTDDVENCSWSRPVSKEISWKLPLEWIPSENGNVGNNACCRFGKRKRRAYEGPHRINHEAFF